MMKPFWIILILLFSGFVMAVPYSNAQDNTDALEKKNKHSIAISEEMDDVVIREATKVKEEFQQKARSLFDRLPLGWDLNTITYLYRLALSLPGKIPAFTRFVIAVCVHSGNHLSFRHVRYQSSSFCPDTAVAARSICSDQRHD